MAYVDSSKSIFGAVIYIESLTTNKISFLLAKNRIVNKKLDNKSIPSLELQAIVLGAELLVELYNEMTGPSCVIPLNIYELALFSDSLVRLFWLDSHVNKFDKMNRKTVFVNNRLDTISRLCSQVPIKFGFCAGQDNPADCISRCLSYKQLIRSNYFNPPKTIFNADMYNIIIPNPSINPVDVSQCHTTTYEPIVSLTPLIDVNKYSSFSKLRKVVEIVLGFVNKLKTRISRSTKTSLNLKCYLINRSLRKP